MVFIYNNTYIVLLQCHIKVSSCSGLLSRVCLSANFSSERVFQRTGYRVPLLMKEVCHKLHLQAAYQLLSAFNCSNTTANSANTFFYYSLCLAKHLDWWEYSLDAEVYSVFITRCYCKARCQTAGDVILVHCSCRVLTSINAGCTFNSLNAGN